MKILIILTELNNKTDLNLKKIRENEKKFDKYNSGTGSGNNEQEEIKLKNNNTDNITNEDKNKTITDCIKEIDNNIKDYKLLLDGIKNNNNSLSQINKSIIETN
jgi:hypothetical protein